MDIAKMRKSIRSELVQQRDNITPSQRTILSKRIISHLSEWIHQKEKSEKGYNFDAVMVYLSMKSEVETWDFVETLLKQDRTIIVPVVDTNSGNLIPKQIQNLDNDLTLHKYGMFEPKDSCTDFPSDKIQLIIVPGIAYDRKGYRIGYGKGYYDRFLPKCPNAITIGTAYQLQIVDNTFPQPWDIPVQYIFSEVGMLFRSNQKYNLCENKYNNFCHFL